MTGAIWSVENGPNGGDEVNELHAGEELRMAGRQRGRSIWVRASA